MEIQSTEEYTFFCNIMTCDKDLLAVFLYKSILAT